MKNMIASILMMVGFFSMAFAQEKPAIELKASDTDSGADFPSLMFLPKELENIKKAERARDTKVPIEILLPEIFGSQLAGQQNKRPEIIDKRIKPELEASEPEVFVYDEPTASLNPADTPIVLLKSVLYLSPNNWTVWLNDKRVSSSDDSFEIEDEKLYNIEVMMVEPRRIIGIWTGFPNTLIMSDFKDRTIDLGGELYASEDMQIVYDASKKRIAFILEPNQAIVPYLLGVFEGGNNAKAELFNETKIDSQNEELPIEESQQQDATLENVKPAKVGSEQPADRLNRQEMNLEKYKKQIDLLQSMLSSLNQ